VDERCRFGSGTVVRLDVDPKNLTAGTYVATVQVTAPGADNSLNSYLCFECSAPGSKLGRRTTVGFSFLAVAGVKLRVRRRCWCRA